MENNNTGSKSMIKTIIFLIIAALYCLIFFGLGNSNKTDLQLTSFGFIMFGIFVLYLSCVLPDLLGLKKLTNADVITIGILYAIAAFVVNNVLVFTTMKTLLIFNIIAILLYLLLLCFVILIKKNKD